MTKRRRLSAPSPVKVEVKVESPNDYLVAKGRLKGVLKQLTEKSSDDASSSADETPVKRGSSKKKNGQVPAPYLHTYVMKLYDRSVDLARFEEETPLYPLCRAWMENQPKNPHQKRIKRRISSPNPNNSTAWPHSTVDVQKMPPPSEPFQTRIPSPLPEQKEQNKNNINLNYDECPTVDKAVLLRDHLKRWTKVKKKWVETAGKNEERYTASYYILETIYNKAQETLE